MRAISISKHKQISRSAKYWSGRVAILRKEALEACRNDPFGTCRLDSERAKALANYCGARRWVTHYRDILASSKPVKKANAHAFKIDVPHLRTEPASPSQEADRG